MTSHSSTLPRTLTLVLGGARSGKSSYAQHQVERRGNGQELLYVATAEAQDEEMLSRIQRHRSERSEIWRTFLILMAILLILEALLCMPAPKTAAEFQSKPA